MALILWVDVLLSLQTWQIRKMGLYQKIFCSIVLIYSSIIVKRTILSHMYFFLLLLLPIMSFLQWLHYYSFFLVCPPHQSCFSVLNSLSVMQHFAVIFLPNAMAFSVFKWILQFSKVFKYCHFTVLSDVIKLV